MKIVKPSHEILPECFINENDLIELGLEPGSNFKKILNTILDLQLKGKIDSKETALLILKGAMHMTKINEEGK